MNQDDLIDKFVNHLSSQYEIQLQIISRPDKINRNSEEVDAIAQGSNLQIAIEHTSIDTIANQRELNARFLRVLGKLEKELEGDFEGFVQVAIPFHAIEVGMNWDELRTKILNWLRTNLNHIPYGHGYHSVQSVPFELHIIKRESASPKIGAARFAPTDKTLSKRIEELIIRKSRKLKNYSERSYKTLLLIENDDIALMYIPDLIKIITELFQNSFPNEVNEIWAADTSIDNYIEFIKI